MASKSSWRLKFIDIDASFSINTESSTVKGYMVVRAPKGEQSTYYFEKGNAEAIYAYVGLPTANWPDLYEAEAFNAEYGLYISAPPGSSDDYPSYFGGAYLTTEGIVDFYNVTSKDTIDYTKKTLITDLGESCKVTTYVREDIKSLYSDVTEVDGSKELMAFYIGTIGSDVWGNLQEIGINYWGDSRSSHAAATKYYYINKEDHKVYVEDEDGNAITDYYCGIWGKGSEGYFIILGGGAWLSSVAEADDSSDLAQGLKSANQIFDALGIANQFSSNTSAHSDAPFFTVNGLIANIEEAVIANAAGADWAVVKNYLEGKSDATAESLEGIEFTIRNGDVFELYTVGTPSTAASAFTGLINLKSKTFMVINQKSASEKTSKVEISNIGYDKWKYDFAVPFIAGDLTKVAKEKLKALGANVFLGWKQTSFPAVQAGTSMGFTLYKFDADSVGSTAADCCANVGADYVSQDFLITKAYIVENGELVEKKEPGMIYNIYYCASKSSFFVETENDASYPLRADINYNTVTFKVTEEVYPGQDTSGGEFTGSLSETGKDSYGANIYWPNVLSDNDFSFVEVTPIQTFENTGMVNSDGIYIGTRIVDDQLTQDFEGNDIGSTYTLKLKGQRYVTHIVEKNIAEGTTGGSWRDEFWPVVQQGWNEAYDTNYDDVFIFMDPTGQEKVHTMQSSIVAGTHQLAIAISPKLITKAEFNNPSSIVVTARNKQCAQFAGEFKVYDEYTGKNFWCCPIGDIGLMCARIFENKMGGWPPAWYNYNNLGGQLSRSVLEARWRFSDAATQIMDTKGINPIIYNADDGLMVVSSKTTQDPNNLTDWSFLEHAMAFLLCKRDIRDTVMRPQIEKPIDDYWMNVRQTQVDAILAKRTTGANKIWTAATCDIKGVNTDITKAQRKFCIYVKVKVTPFAQIVELSLENVAQTTVL